MESLPEDVIIEMLHKMKGSDIISFCKSSKQFQDICKNNKNMVAKLILESFGYKVENRQDTSKLFLKFFNIDKNLQISYKNYKKILKTDDKQLIDLFLSHPQGEIVKFLKWAHNKVTVVWVEGVLSQYENIDSFDIKQNDTLSSFLERIPGWVHQREWSKDLPRNRPLNKYVFFFFYEYATEEEEEIYGEYQEESMNATQLIELWKQSKYLEEDEEDEDDEE